MSELPPGWATATISELCGKPQYGWTTKAAKTGVLQLLRTTDITRGPIDWNSVPWSAKEPPNRQQFLLRSGDIVVSRAGSVGVSAMVHDPRPAVFASYLMRLRPAEEVSGRFIAWFLQAPNFWRQVERASAGIALQNINATKLAAFQMPLPPLAEQRQIVAAIEEQFSRLDAAEAGLVTAGVRIGGLREQAVEHAMRGDWAWTTLGEIASLAGGVTKDSKRQDDPSFVEVPYLRVANVQRGHLDLANVTTIRVPAQKAEALKLQPGDVLFNEGGDRDKLGRGWVWSGEIDGCIHQNHVFRARLHDGFEPRFVSWHANTFGRSWFETHGRQTTNLASLNLTTLKAFPVPAPPLEDQRRIVAELEQQHSLIDSLRSAVESAQKRSAALRRAILERAFRGELVPQDPADEPAAVLLERIRPPRRQDRTIATGLKNLIPSLDKMHKTQ